MRLSRFFLSTQKEAPAVTLNTEKGSGTRATAEVKDGKVVAVEVTEAGKGYTAVPSVAFAGGGGTMRPRFERKVTARKWPPAYPARRHLASLATARWRRARQRAIFPMRDRRMAT